MCRAKGCPEVQIKNIWVGGTSQELDYFKNYLLCSVGSTKAEFQTTTPSVGIYLFHLIFLDASGVNADQKNFGIEVTRLLDMLFRTTRLSRLFAERH